MLNSFFEETNHKQAVDYLKTRSLTSTCVDMSCLEFKADVILINVAFTNFF